jgi:PIN domain nuclease of toxin-antitoxin system
VRVLLDSHVILWWLSGSGRLSAKALAALEAPDSELFVSAASWWELGIKKALGRVVFDAAAVTNKLAEAHVQRILVTFDHAETAAALPPHHSDPFDRMLIAQASLEQLVLATRDAAFAPYGIPLLKA